MKNDDIKSMGKSLEVFDKFLKADATKKLYLRLFTDFLKWTRENIDDSLNPDDLLQFDEKKLQGMIEDYILHIRKRLSPNSLPSNIAALEHYFAMNDKDIQFKRIRKMIPPPNKKGGNSAWTTQDIQKMIRNSTSNRDRAFIHFLASTGCRIGSLEGLKLRHILPMDDCRSVLVYEGSNEEYWAFLTPEACNAVDEYLEERRKDGEIINLESPVFRSAYQVGAYQIKPLSIASAKMIAMRLAHTVPRTKVGKRYNVMSAHGFRKRFNTILKSNDKANPSLAEKIMGHRGVFALDGAYLKPTVQILFNEFKKHIPELTIDDSERKSNRIEELEEKNTEVQNLKEQFEFNNLLVSQFVSILHSMGISVEKLDGTLYSEKDFVIPEKYRIEPIMAKPDESLAKIKVNVNF